MGVKPIHVMSPAERTKLPEVTDFFIDLGMNKEEVEKYVSVGDSVTRERDLVEMGDCVNVKSLDNRAGCYVLIEALRAIKASRKKPSCNFVAAFTVQEEVGLRARRPARWTSNRISPLPWTSPSPVTFPELRRTTRFPTWAQAPPSSCMTVPSLQTAAWSSS